MEMVKYNGSDEEAIMKAFKEQRAGNKEVLENCR